MISKLLVNHIYTNKHQLEFSHCHSLFLIMNLSMPLQFLRLNSDNGSFTPKLKLFHCQDAISSVRCSAGEPRPSVVADSGGFDSKEFRKNLIRRPNYNRNGFGRKDETLELITRVYASKVLHENI